MTLAPLSSSHIASSFPLLSVTLRSICVCYALISPDTTMADRQSTAVTTSQSHMSVVEIHPNHDFTIVAEQKAVVNVATDEDEDDEDGINTGERDTTTPVMMPEVVRATSFKVIRAKLEAIKAVPGKRSRTFWQALFPFNVAQARGKPEQATLEVTSLAAVEILLRVCHETVMPASYMVEIDEMWQWVNTKIRHC